MYKNVISLYNISSFSSLSLTIPNVTFLLIGGNREIKGGKHDQCYSKKKKTKIDPTRTSMPSLFLYFFYS